MRERPVTHQQRPVVEDLRELRDIARREHGAQARSTRRIEELIADEERSRARKPAQRKTVSTPV